jgi:hypothetical protein
MNKVEAFVELQMNANAEIDELGEVSEYTAKKLEEVADLLSPKEIEEAIQLYDKITKPSDK